MSRARLLFLSVVAALSIVALSAGSASAAISFEWFVGGTLLQANQTQAFTLNSDGHNFDLHGTLPAGAGQVLLLSSNISTSNGLLIGGRPGTSLESITFTGVTDDVNPNCLVESLPNPTVGTVTTQPLTNQIVQGLNGEVLILFTPVSSNNAFVTLLLLQKVGGTTCVGANAPANVSGNILGLPSPQRASVVNQSVVFPGTAITTYLLANGAAPLTAALTFAGNAATFTGLTLILLTSGLPYGAF